MKRKYNNYSNTGLINVLITLRSTGLSHRYHFYLSCQTNKVNVTMEANKSHLILLLKLKCYLKQSNQVLYYDIHVAKLMWFDFPSLKLPGGHFT